MPPLEIIYENKDFIVVNKSAGLISEKSPYEKITVEAQVFQHLLKNKTKPYLGVVHRLDRVTSGVLLFAKKKSILVQFNDLFFQKKIKKTYLAIVKNKPKNDKKTLTNHLFKNNLNKRAEITSSPSKKSQLASLSYQLMGENEQGYLLKIEPTTGRFHQIRAQLAHIDLPIIGDEKYGSKDQYLPLSICLHAWQLSFHNPITQQFHNFQAPLPNNEFWKF